MIAKNKHTIVLMPPKTASNSIRVLLENSGFIFYKEKNFVKHPQIHLKLSEIVELYKVENLENYKVIQVTRNPYQRFVSSFFFQNKIIPHGYTPTFKNYNIEQFTKHLVQAINSENFIKAFYGDTSFVENNINNGINWGGSRLYDTQVSWNDLNHKVTYFKLEQISQDLTPLKEFLQLEHTKLPNVNSQKLQVNYELLLIPDLKNIISKIFYEDFKRLKYD
jgi:hypothetical protein